MLQIQTNLNVAFATGVIFIYNAATAVHDRKEVAFQVGRAVVCVTPVFLPT